MNIIDNISETINELDNCSINTSLFDFCDETHLAKVVHCYDGDTIHCIFKHDNKYQKFIIRMFGYDSAEIKQKKSLDPDTRKLNKIKAFDAKNRLASLILNKCVYLYCHKMDKYGRILATIKINHTDPDTVNDLMLKEGFGCSYLGSSIK
jgi:endonuclease YncB( thermonuclease family)